MEKPTKILSDEHQHILVVIDAILRECDKIENGGKADGHFFNQAIDFIRNYADKFHHAKEEDILFVEFCHNAALAHCNPVDQMLYEHDLGRNFVKEIEAGLENNNVKKIIAGSRGYANLLQDHIFKEDNILYPMVDQVLDQKIQDIMLDKFEAIATKKFKSDVINNYLSFAVQAAER